MTRSAPPRRTPTRTCVACRTARDKRDLVRAVRRPDGAVVLDATGRVPGRGAYLCADAACWTLAARRGAIERALGVGLPEELRAVLAAGPTGSAPAASAGLAPRTIASPRAPGGAPSTHTTSEGGTRGQE